MPGPRNPRGPHRVGPQGPIRHCTQNSCQGELRCLHGRCGELGRPLPGAPWPPPCTAVYSPVTAGPTGLWPRGSPVTARPPTVNRGRRISASREQDRPGQLAIGAHSAVQPPVKSFRVVAGRHHPALTRADCDVPGPAPLIAATGHQNVRRQRVTFGKARPSTHPCRQRPRKHRRHRASHPGRTGG